MVGATGDVLDKRGALGGLWKRVLGAVWRCGRPRALLGSTRGAGAGLWLEELKQPEFRLLLLLLKLRRGSGPHLLLQFVEGALPVAPAPVVLAFASATGSSARTF